MGTLPSLGRVTDLASCIALRQEPTEPPQREGAEVALRNFASGGESRVNYPEVIEELECARLDAIVT
jgi:hypothetical protein